MENLFNAIEPIFKGDQLIIAGSGNVAVNICGIASIVGYQVTVIGHIAENLTQERFPQAHQLLLGNIVEILGSCEITGDTSIVLVTHQHEFDEEALCAVINSPARYIGVLGNKRKVTAYFNKLSSMGIPEEVINRIHIPIGLDLGGERAADIALAAVAEIQAVKYGRPGGFLTNKFAARGRVMRDELF